MIELMPANWQTRVLGELFDLNTQSLNPNNFPDEKFDYFSLPAFDEFGSGIRVKGGDIESNKTLIEKDSVLVSKLNPRKPRVIIAQPRNLRTVASTEFMCYSPKARESISLEYFKYFFSSDLFQKRLERVATGSTNSHVRVTPSETIGWKIKVPNLEEQKKIASVLMSSDQNITDQKEKLEKFQNLKRSLLQHLLTAGFKKGLKIEV